MNANDEPTGEKCRACPVKGWRWVHKSRANSERRIDGVAVALVKVTCFECSGIGRKRAT